MTTITRERRFTRDHHCPICGGWDTLPQGKGLRCFGFMSADGVFAYCTRPEYGGALQQNPATQAFSHRLEGFCRCGQQHAPNPSIPLSWDINTGPAKAGTTFRTHGKRVIARTYDYHDAAGILVHQTVRYEPKSFSQRRPGGLGGWVNNLDGVQTVLYRLPALLTAPPGSQVFIVEGEKDADNLVGLGLIATCNPMGAGKWRPYYTPYLRGHHVVIIQDADHAGREHAKKVSGVLLGIAASVRVLEMPDAKDVSDWLGLGHTRADLVGLVDSVSPLIPGGLDLEDDFGPLPAPPPDQVYEENIFARKRLRMERMVSALDAAPAELHIERGTPLYMQLGRLTSRLAMAPTAKSLEPYIAEWLEIKPAALKDRVMGCGVFHGGFCREDGYRGSVKGGNWYCHATFDSGCLSFAGEKIAMTTFPSAKAEGTRYWYIAIQHPWDAPQRFDSETGVEYANAVQTIVENEMDAFHDTVATIAHRRRFKGGLWARCFQQTLFAKGSNFWWGWIVYKDEPGRATGEEFAAALLELLPAAKLKVSAPGHSGETLAMLLMLISRSWLIDFRGDNFLFEGAFNAHQKRRMFQSFGGLQKAIEEEGKQREEALAGKPPPGKDAPYGRCDVCKKPLFEVPVPESIDPHSLKKGDKPAWAWVRWRTPVTPLAPKKPPASVQAHF